MISLHHTHLMSSDVNSTILFFETYFRARVVYDKTFAGARNVFMTLGNGRLHLYDQPPKRAGQGTVHHIGIETTELEDQVKQLKSEGVSVTEIRKVPDASYAMVEAPDGLLIELFQVDAENVDPEMRFFFDSLQTIMKSE